MPRSRPEFESVVRATRVTPATVGRFAKRAGAVITLLAAPLATGAFLVILLGAPTYGAGFDAAVTATTGPLVLGGGVGWVLHVAVLGVLAGTWILGVGLILSGLSD